jgi:hypothetical protein
MGWVEDDGCTVVAWQHLTSITFDFADQSGWMSEFYRKQAAARTET